jgi:hypothetical protein
LKSTLSAVGAAPALKRLCILVLSVASLAGCVSTKTIPLKTDMLAERQGGTAVTSVREKPSFSAMTAGKAMFGVIGAAAMISAGNEIIRSNNVDDPAVYIGDKLLADLANVNALTVVQKNGAIADTNEPDKLSALYPHADVLLDVQTVNWSLAYFPTDFNNYRVIYSVKMRLIDTKKRKVMAEGFCARVPEKTDDAPSYDALVGSNAAGLKKELMVAADYCVSELRTKVLALTPAKPSSLTAERAN